MAEFLQSEVKIIHTVEGGKPTDKSKDTKDSKELGEDDVTKKDKDSKGALRHLGRGAVYRRLANLALNVVDTQVDIYYSRLMFEKSLTGDRVGMVKLQNQQAMFRETSKLVKGGVMAGIAKNVMKNPAIAYLWLANEVADFGMTVQRVNETNRQQRERENVEMFIAGKRNERLRIGTHNRR